MKGKHAFRAATRAMKEAMVVGLTDAERRTALLTAALEEVAHCPVSKRMRRKAVLCAYLLS